MIDVAPGEKAGARSISDYSIRQYRSRRQRAKELARMSNNKTHRIGYIINEAGTSAADTSGASRNGTAL